LDYHKAVVKSYNYFYNKIYKTNYRLDLSQAGQSKMVDSFVRLLASNFGLHSVGINTIVEAFSFSFAYWSTKKTKRKISLGWIIGKKTVSRWLDRDEGVDYYTDKFLKEYSIDLDLLKQELAEEVPKEILALDPAEELEKQRFNGEAKLYNCFQHTTLYHHRSMLCLGCSIRTACKQLLKKTTPQLYIKRGYADNESI